MKLRNVLWTLLLATEFTAATAIGLSCIVSDPHEFVLHWYGALLVVAGQIAVASSPFSTIRPTRGEFTADSMVTVAAALMLPVEVATVAIGLGGFVESLGFQRTVAVARLRDNAVVMTCVFLGLHAARTLGFGLNPPGIAGAALGAAFAEVSSLVLLALQLTLEQRIPSFWGFTLAALPASVRPWPWLVAMGVLIASVASATPWAAPLVAAPLFLILSASRAKVRALEGHRRVDGLLQAATSILEAATLPGVIEAATEGATAILGPDARIDSEPASPGEIGAPVNTERLGRLYLVVSARDPALYVREYGDHDRRVVETLASIAASALDKVVRQADAERGAAHDVLTALPNRRSFTQQLAAALLGSRVGDAGVAVMFVDLDGFKSINDEHGHLAGDEVLVETSRRLVHAVRSGDVVSRQGGDEFTILLHGLHTEADAVPVAERIFTAMRQPVPLRSGADVIVTPSIGIALATMVAPDPVRLMQAADAAMYESKRAGKNCWRVARASSSEPTRPNIEWPIGPAGARRNAG